ncbi:hypothetical protein [Rhodococcus rhodochrous]|uniref:hypothetical protein n=1 Tax=Rhodococcus rhodochrous TaxID=1829 RepID=UPI001E4007AA|nr:hypothetical protein [Rhodococcus rhodochrous]MCD2096566.1 hypothetical protein [Rhodococcus rhodochrous]MCD2121216.1 hypothetical protein [Rhodococcus rhodochrous]MCQ4137309.1 hypothetical protein [Rhodococcus rhodochrous]MDJ0021198.1 hypothetical protein [Rhodococcus rhodochrous]
MSDPTTPEGRAELRELLAKATPEPWQVDDCEGELRIGAGDAVTKWEDRTTEDGRSYRIGTPPRSWKATDLIYEHDLDTWDEGEDQDDDQRRADAELIVAAVNALPALLDALDARDVRIVNLEQGREVERGALRNAIAIIARIQALVERVDAGTVGCSMDNCEGGCFKAECPDMFAEQLRAALDGAL